ncbi:MAG: methylated-DNA--[protein]-cysteine S-methyltransferase [Nitrospira sp.]|nr:methylated-DNA--[protein]-cysteine S-methyltransferase [Nitrospira sp.]
MRRAILFESRWGWMGVAESGKGIDGIALPQTSKQRVLAVFREQAADALVMEPSSQLEMAQAQVLDYLAGKRQTFDVPLDLSRGTAFQRQVWRALLRVPYGKLRSYQWVALRVGGRQYARAVGNAVGANPLPIIVPCHRIVAHDATLGGFSGGLPTKRKLLTLEGTLAQLQRGRT